MRADTMLRLQLSLTAATLNAGHTKMPGAIRLKWVQTTEWKQLAKV